MVKLNASYAETKIIHAIAERALVLASKSVGSAVRKLSVTKLDFAMDVTDMLAALRETLADLEDFVSPTHDRRWTKAEGRAIIRRLQDAIGKAEGADR